MALDEFRHTYLRLCQDHHIEPQECVLQQIKSAQEKPKRSGYCLNLSTHSISAKTCAVLAKVLSTDRAFSELRFNDCMLPEEGVRALVHGMGSNKACKRLDMKGNNIRGSAVEALGRMLRDNTTLLSVCLEWNAAGMLDTAFSVFCEGLGSNSHLQVLDLRNNQISHDGATDLANALKRNSALRVLDLRWNNVGLLGGRALLESLQYNKTITKLELAGNNTPTDILRSIDTAVGHNADQSVLTNDYMARTQLLSREIQTVKQDKHKQLSDLLDKLDKQELAMRHSTKSSGQRIAQLQEALEERKAQFNALAAKMSLAESELALSETKVNELGNFLTSAKEEQAQLGKLHQNDLKREREDRAMVEARLNKELINVNEKNMQLENKVDELERKCRGQQESIYELKEKLAHCQADVKLKATQFEEKVALEKQKTKDAYRDADDIKQKEVDRLRREADEVERTLKDRIQRQEQHRLELEEEVSRLKASSTSDKLHSEEALLAAKQRIRMEEEQRCKGVEEKLRVVQTSKDELQSHSTQQASTITDLQTRNANIILENETLKRRIEDMQTDLSGKNSEMMTEVGRVKIEMNQRIQKLESERLTQAELYDKISKLEKGLADISDQHRHTVEDKDREIKELSDKLKLREAEIDHIRSEDAQRTNMLQSAVQSYVSRSPFTNR